MQIKLIFGNERNRWDAFAEKEPCFALLQSWEWGEFKEKLGWKVFRVAVENQEEIIAGAQLLIKPLPGGFASIAYIPKGPIGNWLDPETASKLFSELHRIAKLYKAIFMKVEPPILFSPSIDQVFQINNFHRSPNTNQPQATIIIDLTPDLEMILMKMRKKTRQYIHSASREEITIRIGNVADLPAYINLMQDTGQREGFSPRSRSYYENEWKTLSANGQCVLLLAYHQNQLLAVRTAYSFGKYAAEFHAGSVPANAELHPNYLLVWEAIKWAKARGCITYDMWGIPDEIGQIANEEKSLPISERTDGLWGVYRFKTGFGKNLEYYAGAFDYVYKPWIYNFINRRLNRNTLERAATVLDPGR